MRGFLAAMALAAALAGCGQRQASGPPATDEASVRAWAEQVGLTDDGWRILGNDAKAVNLVRTGLVEADAFPVVEYDRRAVFFLPQKVGDRSFRSIEARVEADCSQRLAHTAGLQWRSDLQGRGEVLVDRSPPPTWEAYEPRSLGARELEAVCGAAKTAFDKSQAGQGAPPPGPAGRTPGDIDAWVSEHRLGPPDWTLVSGDRRLAVFLRAGVPAPADPAKPFTFWAKTEFFEPLTLGGRTFRSVLEVHEADCSAKRLRTLTALFYPGVGLRGGGVSGGWRPADWSTPAAGTHHGAQLAAACGAKA